MQANRSEQEDKKGSSARFRLNQSLQELLLKPKSKVDIGEGAEVLTTFLNQSFLSVKRIAT